MSSRRRPTRPNRSQAQAQAQGQHKKAASPAHPLLRARTEALRTARRRGLRTDEAAALSELARLHYHLGTPLKSLSFAKDALRVYQQLGDRDRQGRVMDLLSAAHRELGQLDEACS